MIQPAQNRKHLTHVSRSSGASPRRAAGGVAAPSGRPTFAPQRPGNHSHLSALPIGAIAGPQLAEISSVCRCRDRVGRAGHGFSYVSPIFFLPVFTVFNTSIFACNNVKALPTPAHLFVFNGLARAGPRSHSNPLFPLHARSHEPIFTDFEPLPTAPLFHPCFPPSAHDKS